MRILYLADIRFPLERANGIQSMETCHALARRGHAVHMLVRPDTTTPDRDPYEFYGLPRLAQFDIERAPIIGPTLAKRLGYLAFAVGRAAGRGRPDVILTRDLGVASALLRVPRSLRPPLVYESHGYAPEVAEALPSLVATAQRPTPAKLRRLAQREAAVWTQAEGYVSITRGLADHLAETCGPRADVAVVADGVRPPSQPAATAGRAAHERPLIVYAGHLYAWKGVDVLIGALAQLPQADGLIVGGHDREPDLARVRALAESMGLSSRVTFTGLLDPPQVQAKLTGASVLALPNPASAISTRFTSPLKLFEYMAAGRPIVASDLPAIREVLTPDVEGVLVAPGDPSALAAGIARVLDDPALAARLAAAALAKVKDFTWDRRAERLEAVLERARGAA